MSTKITCAPLKSCPSWFEKAWSSLPVGIGSRLFVSLERCDQIALMLSSRTIWHDAEASEMWELVGTELFHLSWSRHGSWRTDCWAKYDALSAATAVCLYVLGQNAFSLGYINRDIKERIQSQLLAMVQLTANVYDTATRDELGCHHVIKVLLRLLSSNIMGICDVACTALGNCVAQSPSSSNQSEVPSPFVALIDQLRGDRMLKELLLSPRVAECGPGPTKHASRALVNMLFPNASIVCLDIDVWEGYIVAKQANERLDDSLAMPVHDAWRISYRLGSGRQYMEGSMKLSTCMRHGAGVSSKGESFRVDGDRHERSGVHNWTFETTFHNDGRPYGPLPISHMAFWSSQHDDVMWGVWEVGASHQQHKLGMGGVFFMHATNEEPF